MIRMLLLLAALVLPVSLSADPRPVTVFAAASLRGALDEVATGFGAPVSLSFGGSGTMARQIAAGAPADVVILANVEWMDWLEQRALVSAGARIDLLRNRLVVIAPADDARPVDPADLAQALKGNRLAMGQRDAVPAGIYARQWLEATGQWDGLMAQLAETDNVRAALALVARGDAPLGIVYRTDAQAEAQVRVVHVIPDDTHAPITYPAAALTPAGAVFLSHLQSPESRDIFAGFGFAPIAP